MVHGDVFDESNIYLELVIGLGYDTGTCFGFRVMFKVGVRC